MMSEKILFGQRIKSLRTGNKWTQEFLAEKININPNYLSSIERGKENPTFDMLLSISKALKIEMWQMFDFGEEAGLDELKKKINNLTKEMDTDELKRTVKVIRAMNDNLI